MKLLSVTFFKLKMMLEDRLFFASMVIIPLLITIATGYALRYEKLGAIPVAFVDEDNSAYSSELVARVSLKEGIDAVTTDRDTAMDMLGGSKVEQVFVIKKGFEDGVQRGNAKDLIELFSSPSSYSAGFTEEVAAGEAMRLISADMAADWVIKEYAKLGKPADGNLRDEVINYNESLWEPKPLMTIDYRELQGLKVNEAGTATMPAPVATSAGVVTAFLMFFILFSSGWLVEERTNGTVKRLAVGPGALFVSFAGSVFSLLIAGAIQVALFSGVDRLLFGVRLFPGLASYLVIFAYLLSVISISLFLSSILKTQAQLQTAAPVLALFTGFAGGCFWNFVDMPEKVRQISLLTPQGWALEGVNRLLAGPADPAAVIRPVLVLFSISLLLLPLSYIIINVHLRKQ